jgi:hypothetical protein
MSKFKYNVELNRGTGLIQETLILLNLYERGMSKKEMTKKAIDENVLVKVLNKRIKDIVEDAFYKRYVISDPNVPIYLRSLVEAFPSLDVITQILLIYTSRAHAILQDFIIQVYWPEITKGKRIVDIAIARKFITESIKQPDLISGWSESTQKRIASYLITTLVDFRLLDKERKVKPVFLHDITANYLAHELHFKGLSDNAVVESEEWKLFGYSRYETIKHLERLSFQGYFILQNSGEIIKINWSYKNMQEFTHAIR